MNTVRRSEISDSRAINRISAVLDYDSIPDDVVQQWLEILLASDEHRVWVCEDDGEIVAWLHASKSTRLASVPFIEIVGLAVSPLRHREGIGRKLVRQAVAWADSQGQKVWVRCNSAREQSHLFYESLGFTRTKSQVIFEYCV